MMFDRKLHSGTTGVRSAKDFLSAWQLGCCPSDSTRGDCDLNPNRGDNPVPGITGQPAPKMARSFK